MNYQAVYEALIVRAQQRRVPEGYTERHHIVPKCLGGSNAHVNLVVLTGREHYVVHQLLTLMHPNVPGLAHAAVKMAHQAVGARAYEWLRLRHGAAMCHPKSVETRAKISASHKASEKTRAHLRALHAGMVGVPHTAERKAAISAAKTGVLTGRPSDSHREAVAASKRGVRRTPFSLEWRAKMSASQCARWAAKRAAEATA